MTKIIFVFTLLVSHVQAQTGDTASRGVETRGSTVTQPSVNAGANQAQSGNRTAQIMSYLSGGIMISTGYTDISAGYASSPTTNWGLVARGVFEVALGIMQLKQGNENGKTAGQAGFTGIQTNGYGMDSGPGNLDPYDLNNPNNPLLADPSFKAISSNLKNLEKMGVLDLKNGTIKGADGKTYKVSDFSSAGSMAAAGLPKGGIDGAMAFADAVGKKAAEKMDKMKLGAMTAASGYEEGGGGSAAGVATGSDGSASGGMAGLGLGSAGKLGVVRDPAALAGMQKNYNGEPIGVAADSIFLMMNRRYKVKESQESFFTDADLALQK